MRIRHLVVASLGLALASCAGSSERPTVEEELRAMGLQRAVDVNASIPRYRINGWRSLDDENIVITAGVNNRYLIELQPGCFDIENAFSIGFRTPTSRLDRFGRVVYRSSINGVQTCAIRNIYQLERI